jgi:F0F1-type ATP synthase delta subunit
VKKEAAKRAIERLAGLCVGPEGIDEAKVRQVLAAIKQSRPANFPQLARSLRQSLRLIDKQQRAVIASAEILSPEIREKIQRMLTKMHPGISSFTWERDELLLGGITILAQDHWYDASLKHDLEQIQEQL